VRTAATTATAAAASAAVAIDACANGAFAQVVAAIQLSWCASYIAKTLLLDKEEVALRVVGSKRFEVHTRFTVELLALAALVWCIWRMRCCHEMQMGGILVV